MLDTLYKVYAWRMPVEENLDIFLYNVVCGEYKVYPEVVSIIINSASLIGTKYILNGEQLKSRLNLHVDFQHSSLK